MRTALHHPTTLPSLGSNFRPAHGGRHPAGAGDAQQADPTRGSGDRGAVWGPNRRAAGGVDGGGAGGEADGEEGEEVGAEGGEEEGWGGED